MKTNHLALAAVLGGIVAPAQAQEFSRELAGFEVNASVDSRWTENAGLQPDAGEKVDEVQTVATLAAVGRLEGAWAEFTTDYELEDRHYSEFSENNESILLGDSQLILGPQHRRYYAQFAHSSREVSLDPLVEDIPSNRDNRVITSGTLFGSLKAGRVNTLSAWVGAADIQFDETTENESSRYSVGTNFDHAISPIYTTGLALTYYDLHYRYLDDQDLSYGRAGVVWRAALRKLQYGFEVGVNTMETEQETTSSPAGKFNVAYHSGAQIFSASYQQFLSDTSQGSDSTGEFNPSGGVDGRLDGEVDQFESRQFLLGWRHAQICDVCGVNFLLGFDEEDYLNLKELSSRETSLVGDFTYRMNRHVSFNLRAEYSDFEPISSPAQDGYQETELDVSLEFPNVVRNGYLDFYVGGVERNYELKAGYTSGFVGARFRYELYER